MLGGCALFLFQMSNFYSEFGGSLSSPERLAVDRDLYSPDGDIDKIQILISEVNISESHQIYLEILITSDTDITSQSIINNIELDEKSIIFRDFQQISKDSERSFLFERDFNDLKPHSNLTFIIIAWELDNGAFFQPKDTSHLSLRYHVQYFGRAPLWGVYSFLLGSIIFLIIAVIIFIEKRKENLLKF